MVEQRTENPCVPGSIPGGTTSKALIIQGFFYFKAYPNHITEYIKNTLKNTMFSNIPFLAYQSKTTN
ncbi:hypothetical protein T190820D02B_10692 [Tenacibaculum sp. 190524A05c]